MAGVPSRVRRTGAGGLATSDGPPPRPRSTLRKPAMRTAMISRLAWSIGAAMLAALAACTGDNPTEPRVVMPTFAPPATLAGGSITVTYCASKCAHLVRGAGRHGHVETGAARRRAPARSPRRDSVRRRPLPDSPASGRRRAASPPVHYRLRCPKPTMCLALGGCPRAVTRASSTPRAP